MSVTQTNVVVRESDVRKTAYEYGYRQGIHPSELAGDEIETPIDLSHYYEGAHYITTILPRLRTMSGFGDSAEGTQTDNRNVIFIPNEDEDDTPVVEGQTLTAEWVLHHHATDAFEKGMRDKHAGNENAYDRVNEE